MDIHEYLKRMDYQGSLEPTFETLRTLHEAHLLAVPFENLSIHTGQPIILQEEALYEKIIHQRRGGFCYELNGLFAWLLRQLGFQVTLLSAEVAQNDGGFSPAFDHLALAIHHLSGTEWLADVGFGDLYRQPLRVEADVEQLDVDGRVYRLQRQDEMSDGKTKHEYWIVQRLSNTQWEAQYRFTLEPHALADFTARCHYQQTSPESHFTQKRICSRAIPTGRITLSDLCLITTTQGERKEQWLTGQEEYTAALAAHFGIVL